MTNEIKLNYGDAMQHARSTLQRKLSITYSKNIKYFIFGFLQV